MWLCSTSLVNLSLIGCRAVTALELKCPNLDQVCLDGCDHLERAAFCPVSSGCIWVYPLVYIYTFLLFPYAPYITRTSRLEEKKTFWSIWKSSA